MRMNPAWLRLSAAANAIACSPITMVQSKSPASVLPPENHPPRKPIGFQVGSRPVASKVCEIVSISETVGSMLSQFLHGKTIERIAAPRQETDHMDRILANSIGELSKSSM